MATSGSKTVAVTNWDSLVFSWSVTSQSIINNTSTVAWALRLVSTSSGAISSTASKVWTVTVNGVTYNGTTTVGISNNSTKTLASGTTVISHNTDGSKVFSFSFSQYFGITFSGSQIGTISGSGTGTLNIIPRSSDLNVSNGTLGTAQTITATRKASSYTHTLTWVCGSYSGTIATKSSDTSWSFTPAMELANGAPYGSKVYCSFTLTTYNGSTAIGSVTKATWMTIPDSVKPSCSISVSDSTGYADTFGGYVQGKSKLAITVNPTTAYGSPITTYLVNANDATYTSQNATTDVLKNSGTNTITATVKDGRGRSGTAQTSVSVLEYNEPTIENVSVHRCDADGVENASGGYCKVTFSYDITPLNDLNQKTAVIKYKKTTDTQYTSLTLSAVYHADKLSAIFQADDGSSYDVMLQITDSFATTDRTVLLSTGYCIYHIPSSGKGVTFGGIAEKDGFNVKMPAHFSGALTQDIPVVHADCNKMITSGTYYLGINATNRPVHKNGWLTVRAYLTGAYCSQHFITYTGEQYFRVRQDSVWGVWTEGSGGGGGTDTSEILVITEDMVTVTKTTTKGVAPYNTSYYYTDITVNADFELRTGVVITPVVVSSMVVASSYRNVRIRFGSNGAWLPVMGTSSILAGSSYFTKTNYRFYQYRTDQIESGAFHLMTDSNTTYTPMALGFGYGTCSTAEATSAKTVAISSYALTNGGMITVKFDNAVKAGATLNVTSKGAKPIYYNGVAITDGIVSAGDVVQMIYTTSIISTGCYNITVVHHADGGIDVDNDALITAVTNKVTAVLQ